MVTDSNITSNGRPEDCKMRKTIRSTKVTLKFANATKKASIASFVAEYTSVTQKMVDVLWGFDTVPVLPSKKHTSTVTTWLSARALQCAAKQASGIVRGARAKQERRAFVIKKLRSGGCTKKARKLERIHAAAQASKPVLKTLECQLDSRFVSVDLNSPNSFDGWVRLGSLGRKLKVAVPFKRNKHFNGLLAKGRIVQSVRLSKNGMAFAFEVTPVPATKGIPLGIDIGYKNCLTASNGFATAKNGHGHDLETILNVITRRQKGSKGFRRAQEHRKNYIGWAVNSLNLAGVGQLRLENIKNLRKGKSSSKQLTHWNYRDIFGRLESKCELAGVQVVRVSPTYTSQRCFQCGWVRKGNRKGKQFKCGICGYAADSDLNAAMNISLNLPDAGKKRSDRANRTGFYWPATIQDPVVPVTQQTSHTLLRDR